MLVAAAAVLASAGQQRLLTDEQRAYEIAAGLRCPVCQDLSAADSSAPLARQMRARILEQVRTGGSAEEIQQGFVDAYGTSVLLTPPARGWGWVARLLPFLVLGVAVAGGALVLRGARRPGRTEPARAEPERMSAEDQALVDRALRELLQEER